MYRVHGLVGTSFLDPVREAACESLGSIFLTSLDRRLCGALCGLLVSTWLQEQCRRSPKFCVPHHCCCYK